MGGAIVEGLRACYHCWDADAGGEEFEAACCAVCDAFGLRRISDPTFAAFSIAPRLTRKLSALEWSAPNHGTLIFHPSLLPARRGPDAVRWAVLSGDPVAGASWFFASEGLDAGPVCEQEAFVLDPSESPGRAYHSRFCPAGLRALERAVRRFTETRSFRHVPQDEALATYQGRWSEEAAERAAAALAEARRAALATSGTKRGPRASKGTGGR